jgi:hypothetical protein
LGNVPIYFSRESVFAHLKLALHDTLTLFSDQMGSICFWAEGKRKGASQPLKCFGHSITFNAGDERFYLNGQREMH